LFGSIDKDLSSSSIRRKLWSNPVVLIFGCELGMDKVSDSKLSMVSIACHHHTCRQPVWKVHREGIGVVSLLRIFILSVLNDREGHVDNLFCSRVRLVLLTHHGLLFSIEGQRERRGKELPSLPDVD
jgi:hypothetical protein